MVKKSIVVFFSILIILAFFIFNFIDFKPVLAQVQCPDDKEINSQIEKCKNSGLSYSISYDERQCRFVKCVGQEQKLTVQQIEPKNILDIKKITPQVNKLEPALENLSTSTLSGNSNQSEKLEPQPETTETNNDKKGATTTASTIEEEVIKELEKVEAEKNKPIEEINQKLQESNLKIFPIIKKLEIKEGKTFLEDKEIQLNKVKVEVMGREIEIERKVNSIIEINDRGIKAQGDIPIEYANGVLKSGKSGKEIKFFPSQIIKKTKEILASQIKYIKIADEKKWGLVYNVKVEKKGKLLALFSVKFPKEYKISAEDGSFKRIKSAWWSFLVKKDPDPVVVNLQCPLTDSSTINLPENPYDFSRGDCASLGQEEKIETYIQELTAIAQNCLNSIDDNIRRWNEQKQTIINYLRNAPQYSLPERSNASNSEILYTTMEETVPSLPLFSTCHNFGGRAEGYEGIADGFAYTSLLEKMKEAVSSTCERANVLNEDLVCLCEDVADYINGKEKLLPEHKEQIINMFENYQLNESVINNGAEVTFDWLNHLVNSWRATYNPQYIDCSLKLKLPRDVIKNIEESIKLPKLPEKQILP